MKTIRYAWAAVALLAAGSGAHAANVEAGRTKAQEVCQACHGMDLSLIHISEPTRPY